MPASHQTPRRRIIRPLVLYGLPLRRAARRLCRAAGAKVTGSLPCGGSLQPNGSRQYPVHAITAKGKRAKAAMCSRPRGSYYFFGLAPESLGTSFWLVAAKGRTGLAASLSFLGFLVSLFPFCSRLAMVISLLFRLAENDITRPQLLISAQTPSYMKQRTLRQDWK